MRLLTIAYGQGTRAALDLGAEVALLDQPDVGAVLREAGDLRGLPSRAGPRLARAAVRLLPVVPRPDKIIGLGLNFHSHLRELGREPPDYPTLFAKFSGSLVGARDPIVLPRDSTRMDWEAELAIVVGRRVRRAGPADAERAIAGYAVINDVTARDWQTRTRQFLQGKTFEATSPFGPALVTADEAGDLGDRSVRCTVDGRTVQDEKLSDMIWDPPALVSYASAIITLEPGDVIAAGTPAGVGRNAQPPVFLRPGQVVRTSIDGLGELVNRCVSEAGAGDLGPGPAS